MGKLEGKTVIITGGGTGIGEITSLMFAADGAHVIVAGRRSKPIEETVASIHKNGGSATSRSVDIESPSSVETFNTWISNEYEAIDILVNNAGHSSKVRSLRYVSKDEWDSVLNVNLTGVYMLCQAVLPGMIQRGEGTIITVSSMAAIRPGLLGGAPYSAAKAGVLNLMGNINSEFGNMGIRACSILPAEVDTPIMANRPLPPGKKERSTMMGPSDIAEVLLLCATLPQRTVVEQVVLAPLVQRDVTADIEAARNVGSSSHP